MLPCKKSPPYQQAEAEELFFTSVRVSIGKRRKEFASKGTYFKALLYSLKIRTKLPELLIRRILWIQRKTQSTSSYQSKEHGLPNFLVLRTGLIAIEKMERQFLVE